MTATATATSKSSGSLRTYLVTRLLLVIPMVWILVTIVFFVMRIVGDPIASRLSGHVPPSVVAQARHQAGLDRPLLTQYGEYLWGILRFNFGKSITDNQPVTHLIVERGAATLELTIYSLIVAFLIGIPLGRIAARYRDRPPDVLLRLFAVLGYAMPVFFLGLLLKLLFAIKLGWLPASGRASPNVETAINNVSPNTHIYLINAILYGDNSYIIDVIKHAILPAVTLGLLTGGIFLRLVRVNLLQTMRSDYVEAARARGVPERKVLRKHAFKNALIPVVTVMGLQIAGLLAGAVLTESTFEWRGIGFTLAQYIENNDFIAVQGIVAALAVIVAVASLIIDVIAAVIDPRVRY
jgi:peptide/nickel transport system permease protein